jgi:hypothetical protein
MYFRNLRLAKELGAGSRKMGLWSYSGVSLWGAPLGFLGHDQSWGNEPGLSFRVDASGRVANELVA